MAAATLTERQSANLHGVLSCYDRIIVAGTLPGACCAGGTTSFLYSRGIRIFDYPRSAEPLRERIRERAQQVCDAAGVQIEHVSVMKTSPAKPYRAPFFTTGEPRSLCRSLACSVTGPWAHAGCRTLAGWCPAAG